DFLDLISFVFLWRPHLCLYPVAKNLIEGDDFMNSSVQMKPINDPTITENDHFSNPQYGKYRIEILPLPQMNPYNAYCICLVTYRKFGIFSRKKAIVTYDDFIHITKALGNYSITLDFNKTKTLVYPQCKIFKFKSDELTLIQFM